MKHLYTPGLAAVCLAVGLALPAAAQTAEQTRSILAQTNIAELLRIEKSEEARLKTSLEAARAKAKAEGKPEVLTKSDGTKMYLRGLGDAGELLYITTDNLGAAKTIRTDRLWSGGATGMNLSGRNIRVSIWDGGGVRLTHREFTGRHTQAEGAIAFEDHPTHVAGTITAKGVDPNAKGGAYEATLRAFTFDNDTPEMTVAARSGLLISNHSYGVPGGWNCGSTCTWTGNTQVNPTYDYRFGFYDSEAQSWDNIAFSAPFYTMFKSAGNERGEGPNPPSAIHPADGQYDCMTGPSNSKNVITVAAVNKIASGNYTQPSQVVMSSFSSWGPTDDGRIKPDISAVGVNVWSSISTTDNSYAFFDGTSMASPNAAAAGVLLQEAFANTHNGRFMRSATLRGLIIHTANEAGTTAGPDYKFGHGLLNAEAAANTIRKDSLFGTAIMERTLTAVDTFYYQFTTNGTVPVKASITWTDPAGTPGAAAYNNRTIKLVNDLDLRIVGLPSALPWTLDPTNQTAAAVRADNIRDNVEVVDAGTPAAGTYTIKVYHKGTLTNNRQAFSLIVTGMTPLSSATCSPFIRYQASNGRLADGSGRLPAANDLDCRYSIDMGDQSSISIRIDTLNLQPGDSLYIRQGTATGPLVAALSGNALPAQSILVTGGVAALQFVTDGANPSDGWHLTWVQVRPPQATVSATATDVCTGVPVGLRVDAQANDTTGWRFSWSIPGSATPTTSVVNPSVTFTSGGHFLPVLTLTNAGGTTVVSPLTPITVRPSNPTAPYALGYREGFESLSFPNDADSTNRWQIQGRATNGATWERTTAVHSEGIAGLRIFNNTTTQLIRSLITPSLDAQSIRPAAPADRSRWVKFNYAFAPRSTGTYTDKLTLYRSTNCGATWQLIVSRSQGSTPSINTVGSNVNGVFIPTSQQWRHDSVQVQQGWIPAAATSLMFKFEMTSQTGNYLYFDDFRLVNNVVGLKPTLAAQGMTLAPNPTEGQLRLFTDGASNGSATLQLTDLQGRNLHQMQANVRAGQAIVLDEWMQQLPAGLYQLRVQTADGVSVTQVVKN